LGAGNSILKNKKKKPIQRKASRKLLEDGNFAANQGRREILFSPIKESRGNEERIQGT